MASVWIRIRETKDGERRYLVEYRAGGREARVRHAGSFRTRRLATVRAGAVESELAAGRMPDYRRTALESTNPTFERAASTWRASRLDIAESTREQHRIQIDKLLLLIGTRRIDELTAADFADVVARLHADGVARETIRKTLGAAAMTLDHAGITPNPVRDRSIKLPREEPEEFNPPSAAHVEAVYRLIPSRHRLPLLWLDWSGARVSSVDLTRIGDYDEPRSRLRLRAATTKTRQALSGSTSTPLSPTPSSWRSVLARTATQRPACSPRAGPMRFGRRSRRHAGRPGSRSGRRTIFATDGSR